MATPILTATSFNAQVIPGNAGSVRINVLDADGAALDVSTGYTLDYFKAFPASDANPEKAPVDLTSNFTATFDETGVLLSYSAAQASTIAAALYTLRSNCGVGLSNDSGTTTSVAASGTLQVVNDSIFIA